MVRRLISTLAALVLLASLAACDFGANVRCTPGPDGTVVCNGTYTPTTPATTVPPSVTTPPTVAPTTAPPTSSTTPRATTPTLPPVTTAPPAQTGSTAAARFGWGTPVPLGSDEFSGTRLDTAKWGAYSGAGHDGNGRRVAANNTVQDGFLRQTGLANGDTAGLASKYGQKYGRWEVRARSSAEPGATGNTYHPVLIAWPDSDQWPAGAEYDFLENGAPGEKTARAFLHYPNHQPKRQEEASKAGVDLSEWHNFGFEWTPNGLKGFIDGVEWFSFNKNGIQNAPGPMHLTVQLDNFHGRGMQEAYFDIDWARAYKL